ncbi:MAG: serine/threonine protein kinase, partial [Deltaproteobacteria bacterium]|nr:serine/threonine protein kinase [Deltaproteobacteria bacterium]
MLQPPSRFPEDGPPDRLSVLPKACQPNRQAGQGGRSIQTLEYVEIHEVLGSSHPSPTAFGSLTGCLGTPNLVSSNFLGGLALIGKTLAHYEVISLLGKGGMGEVYRARDSKLGRDVALKVLPREMSGDPEQSARFEREARTLASLQHPNVATIYGFEQVDNLRFLTMELIEGKDLSEQLTRGAIPIEEALRIALQIAIGLEAAHEKNIVHRDLKPANIKVDPDGVVKILDFGLARAYAGDPNNPQKMENSPTITSAMTQAGTILGTAAYMSPEQARGRTVDKRADIWAFGAVFFEMLAGGRAFEGSDIAHILSAVIRVEPDLDRLPAETPRSVRRLIQRCLRKDPRDRLRDIGDARIEIEEALGEPQEADAHAEARPRQSTSRKVLPWAIVAILAATLVGLFMRSPNNGSGEIPLRRFTIDIPWDAAPNWSDFRAVVSPSGTHVAYNCREGNQVSICVRALDSLSPSKPLTEARDIQALFFSPNSDWVAFYDGKNLAKVSIHGGATQMICRLEAGSGARFSRIFGFSWGNDNNILIGVDSGLYRVAAASGELELIT